MSEHPNANPSQPQNQHRFGTGKIVMVDGKRYKVEEQLSRDHAGDKWTRGSQGRHLAYRLMGEDGETQVVGDRKVAQCKGDDTGRESQRDSEAEAAKLRKRYSEPKAAELPKTPRKKNPTSRYPEKDDQEKDQDEKNHERRTPRKPKEEEEGDEEPKWRTSRNRREEEIGDEEIGDEEPKGRTLWKPREEEVEDEEPKRRTSSSDPEREVR